MRAYAPDFMTSSPTRADRRPIVAWLSVVYVLILGMIVLGGVTRLTQSGLSIVEWKLIRGVVPPLNDVQWQAEFDAYKRATGQAALMFPNLTVAQFKPLYYWEWSHRLTGRLMGVVFLLPFLWFLWKRRLDPRLATHLAAAFVFGGLQGTVGWIMVMSGLKPDAAHVDHIKLTLHLSLALTLLSWLVGLICSLLPPQTGQPPRWLKTATIGFLVLLAVQIVYGALTAGIRAGYFYNSFPKMMGMWIPPETFAGPLGHNLLNNPTTIQWMHRTLGWLVGFAAIALWWTGSRPEAGPRARQALRAMLLLTLLQFGLGVATLLLAVPVWLGAWHQLNAALLLSAVIVLLQACRTSPRPEQAAG